MVKHWKRCRRQGEIVTIHVGEAGISLGNAAWELYCIEHGIRPDGIVRGDQDPCSLDAFFVTTSAGKCIPRAILVDSESSMLDSVRTGAFRYLYNPKQLISGKEDAANCFAKGYMTIGREMIDALLERVRVSTEECSRFQGFIIYRAVGGGTGSGLACYLLEQLANDYKKPSRIEISIYPSPKLSSVVVEPYNALFATHLGMDTIDCSLVFDNDAVYDICDRELGISSPNFGNVNRVVAQVISTVTAQFRFEGNPSINLMEFQTNLVPFPRIHFPLVSYSPFARQSRIHQENFTVSSITNACFEARNQMVKCNSRDGKYVSCCLLYRGDAPIAEINGTLASIKMKKSVNFVSWLPTKFKVLARKWHLFLGLTIGVNLMPPLSVPGGDMAAVNRACAMIANNSAIQTTWEKMNRKFDMIYNKKAFIHWYIAEGLEENDFLDTRMDMEALLLDYKEVESDT